MLSADGIWSLFIFENDEWRKFFDESFLSLSIQNPLGDYKLLNVDTVFADIVRQQKLYYNNQHFYLPIHAIHVSGGTL